MKRLIHIVLMVLLILNICTSNVEAINHVLLDDLIQNNPDLQGALVGISVRSAKTGEVVYEHLGDTRLRPASNMKLFTAAAALSFLGEEHKFTTDLYTDGNVKWKVLNGDLYIKGNGDPTLLKKDLTELVQQLKAQGIRMIRGNLIADDYRYDDKRYSTDLSWSDEGTYYGAQISALTISPDHHYDTGTVMVEVTGTKNGDNATVAVTPLTDRVTLVNHCTTIGAEQKVEVTISREHGTNVIHIEGVIPESTVSYKERISLWEPSTYVLELLKQSLKEQGILLLGDTKKGKIPVTAKQLVSHNSMPLSELLIPFMKLSNNAHAETLIKEMGYLNEGEGSWEKGLHVLQDELKKWNIETESMVLRDGSGISHVSGIPAHQISKLLYEIQSEPWFPTYLRSLPIVDGKDNLDRGTLHERMKHTEASGRVRAKTGTLTTVSSLAGYIEPKDEVEETLIFSIILNQVIDGEKAKQLEDQMVLAMLNK